MATRSRISAGILLYRRRDGRLEVLLAHPGGPFFARKDAGHWTIPKGEVEPGEEPLAVATREFEEETGHDVPPGPLVALGSITQKGGKLVHGWAVEGDLDPAAAKSNTFELEWPPRSGRMQAFPEVDRVEWFAADEARRRIRDTQAPLIDRLEASLDEGGAVFLETERLVLRQFTRDDVEHLLELDSDPEVMRYITGGRATPREEIENDVLPAFLRYYERDAGFGFWAAVEKESGRFVGWFHFRPTAESSPGEVELGYRLHRSAWGRGYATEGSRALIDKGFAEHDVERVFAHTMVVNVASRRVMEKAGLRFVRIFHADWPETIDGDEHGDVEYALTRPEWERARAAARAAPPR